MGLKVWFQNQRINLQYAKIKKYPVFNALAIMFEQGDQCANANK